MTALLTTPTVRELDHLTARVFATRESGARLEAYRRDKHFYLDIDLPGIDPASVDITVDGKMLTVRAERKAGAPSPVGDFSRQVKLAEKIDIDRIEARCDNGVLTLEIPVVEG
jgi:HSP20 family protein